MPVVTVLPHNLRLNVEKGTVLLEALREKQIDLLSLCGGMGECELCAVEVAPADSGSHSGGLFPESQLFHSVLSCQFHVTRDIFVRVPDWRSLY